MSSKSLWHRKLGFVGVSLALLSIIAIVSFKEINKTNYGRKLSHRSMSPETLTQKLLHRLSSSQNGTPEKVRINVQKLIPTPSSSQEEEGIKEGTKEGKREEKVSKEVNIFEWESYGELWTLRTWSDSKFLSPSSLVWSESDNDSRVDIPDVSCFVRGVVEGASNQSDVALNICNGLNGVIQIGHLVFLIEPLITSESEIRTDLSSVWEGQTVPHVIQLVSQVRSETNNDKISEISDEKGKEFCMAPTTTTGSNDMSNFKNRNTFKDFLSSYTRSKRFVFSKRHTIEIMVVVDDKMLLYHGNQIDQYVLTLMSVVSLIFRDSSIGNNIDIAVVEIVKGQSFVNKTAYDNYSTASGKSAEGMLKMFCKWQTQRLKSNQNHPRRYDAALLITRENICRNPHTQSCDTLGLAELGTMCFRHASCAIVQDNGLSAAFTIAHEMGHLLNMPHDNDSKCSPFRENGSMKHLNIMSRMLDHNTLPWIWSNCSKFYLVEFFQAGLGDCLEDEPWSNKISEDDIDVTIAGELFSATQQCQYVYGKTSVICPYMPKCKRLWCTTLLDGKGSCRTQHMPWADGTPCDKYKWCLRGECKPKNRGSLKRIQGMWGTWQPWTPCSRTCGVGVRKSERYCDSPKPRYGGRFCIGERIRYESCKIRDCSRGALDFRSQQCEEFNGKNYGLRKIPENVIWRPKHADRRADSCKLFCETHDGSISYLLKEKVEDGTPCDPDSYDICVAGKCRVAGCDSVLNSTVEDDWCGVCNGDNSTCQLLTGSMKDAQPYGYSNVIVIPEGAARIEIIQKSSQDRPPDDNYLALVDYETGNYLLNGDWIVTPFEKLVKFGGSLLMYTGSNQSVERINSTKPLQKKLLVQILSVGKLSPPFISYSFSKSNQETAPTYIWKLEPWTQCSRPCIGDSEQIPFCLREDTNVRVADYLCDSIEKPIRRRKACSLGCSVRWTYSKWSTCKFNKTKTCVRERVAERCITSANTPVVRERCKDLSPITQNECDQKQCPLWTYGEWTPCACLPGKYSAIQKRLYACYLNERPVNEWECIGLEKPSEERECSCWVAGDWSPKCYIKESTTMLEHQRPEEQEISSKSLYLKGRSSLSEYSYNSRAYTSPKLQKATVYEQPNAPIDSCPWGEKRRKVTCGSPYEQINSKSCNPKIKPREVSACKVPCEKQSTTYQPIVSPFTIATESPNYDHQYKKTFSPLASEEKKDRDETTRNEIKYRIEKPKGGLTKGGKKDSSTHGYNRVSYTIDSGEKEHNDLFHRGPNTEKNLWYTGKWSECSKKCGVGERRRIVKCERRDQCSQNLRPKSREKCNVHPCTEWSLTDWGRCLRSKRDPCRGKKRRIVVCRNSEGQQVNTLYCLTADRPQSEATCKISCNRNKRLNKRYKWRKSRWSPCSVPCGPGVQKRELSCHRVSHLGWVDPDPVDHGCRKRKTPIIERACNMGVCSNGYFWVTRAWKSCQAPCGSRGRQRRSIICVNSKGSRSQRSRCSRSHRPKRKQRCRTAPCGYKTCKEVRSQLGVMLDGEYNLLVAGVNMSIYCLAMNGSNPKEFLSLPAGEEGNYAEIYNKRLLKPDTCPFNGEKSDSCHCVDDESGRAGLTTFSKIRINTTSLTINTFDFTFARANTGRMIAYGEAGDCYSMAQCPQGSFSINLAGTLLRVSERTIWKGHGSKAAHWISHLDVRKYIDAITSILPI